MAVNPASGVVAVYQDETERENGLLLPVPGSTGRSPSIWPRAIRCPSRNASWSLLFRCRQIRGRSAGCAVATVRPSTTDLNLAFDLLPSTLTGFGDLAAVDGQPGRYRQAWATTQPALPAADRRRRRRPAFGTLRRRHALGHRWRRPCRRRGKGAQHQTGRPDSDSDGLTDAEEALWESIPPAPTLMATASATGRKLLAGPSLMAQVATAS